MMASCKYLQSIFVLQVVLPCGLQLWKWKQHVPEKCWYLPTIPHSSTTFKSNINIFATIEHETSLQFQLVEKTKSILKSPVCRVLNAVTNMTSDFKSVTLGALCRFPLWWSVVNTLIQTHSGHVLYLHFSVYQEIKAKTML